MEREREERERRQGEEKSSFKLDNCNVQTISATASTRVLGICGDMRR